MFVRANFVDIYLHGMRDRSMRSGTELAREIKLTDWSMVGNLSNRSSGVQIPRDICSWMINCNVVCCFGQRRGSRISVVTTHRATYKVVLYNYLCFFYSFARHVSCAMRTSTLSLESASPRPRSWSSRNIWNEAVSRYVAGDWAANSRCRITLSWKLTKKFRRASELYFLFSWGTIKHWVV